MQKEILTYEIDGKSYVGYLVRPDHLEDKSPIILVAHAWKGQDDFARQKAQALAELGYIGFAIDLYGEGQCVQSNEEATALMMPLFLDRTLLQKRVRAAYEVACSYPYADAKHVGAIGFCFGGLAAIELLRSGAAVQGVVSFHAILGNQKGENKAQTVPVAENIKGSLLMLHGYEDPLVSQEDIQVIQRELTNAKVDWQMHIYSHTSHAFTVPEAYSPEMGLIFNSQSSQRAWLAMCNFFIECM